MLFLPLSSKTLSIRGGMWTKAQKTSQPALIQTTWVGLSGSGRNLAAVCWNQSSLASQVRDPSGLLEHSNPRLIVTQTVVLGETIPVHVPYESLSLAGSW